MPNTLVTNKNSVVGIPKTSTDYKEGQILNIRFQDGELSSIRIVSHPSPNVYGAEDVETGKPKLLVVNP